jgi:hypothetical protein
LSLPLQAKSRTIEAAATLLQVRLIFALLPFAQALRFLRIEKSPAACGRVAAAEAAEIGLANNAARTISRCVSSAGLCRFIDAASSRRHCNRSYGR